MIQNDRLSKIAANVSQSFELINIEKFLIKDEGILAGGGGGFMMRFTDFLITLYGETSVFNYRVDYSGTPYQIENAPLLLGNRSDEYARLMQMAFDINFFNIKLNSPNGSELRHIAVVHPNYGIHRVIWEKNSSKPPSDLIQFHKEIRSFLLGGFQEEFGD